MNYVIWVISTALQKRTKTNQIKVGSSYHIIIHNRIRKENDTQLYNVHLTKIAGRNSRSKRCVICVLCVSSVYTVQVSN